LELTGEVDTNRNIKAEVSSSNQLVDGLKVTLSAQSNKDQAFATLSDEYKHELASVTGSIDYGKDDGSTANTSFVVGVDKYALGAGLTYHLNQGLKSFEGKLAYASPDFDVTLFSYVFICLLCFLFLSVFSCLHLFAVLSPFFRS
jgi:hypothetical protein